MAISLAFPLSQFLLTSITFILPATVVMDRVSDRSKGFGFVTYASEDEAEKAIAEMNGKVVQSFLLYFPLPTCTFPILNMIAAAAT